MNLGYYQEADLPQIRSDRKAETLQAIKAAHLSCFKWKLATGEDVLKKVSLSDRGMPGFQGVF
jgi:hypothetical protein